MIHPCLLRVHGALYTQCVYRLSPTVSFCRFFMHDLPIPVRLSRQKGALMAYSGIHLSYCDLLPQF